MKTQVTDEEMARLREIAQEFAPLREGAEEIARNAVKFMMDFLKRRTVDTTGKAEQGVEDMLYAQFKEFPNYIEAIALAPGALGWIREEGNREGKRLGLPRAGYALERWIGLDPKGAGHGAIARFLCAAKKPNSLRPMAFGKASRGA